MGAYNRDGIAAIKRVQASSNIFQKEVRRLHVRVPQESAPVSHWTITAVYVRTYMEVPLATIWRLTAVPSCLHLHLRDVRRIVANCIHPSAPAAGTSGQVEDTPTGHGRQTSCCSRIRYLILESQLAPRTERTDRSPPFGDRLKLNHAAPFPRVRRLHARGAHLAQEVRNN